MLIETDAYQNDGFPIKLNLKFTAFNFSKSLLLFKSVSERHHDDYSTSELVIQQHFIIITYLISISLYKGLQNICRFF